MSDGTMSRAPRPPDYMEKRQPGMPSHEAKAVPQTNILARPEQLKRVVIAGESDSLQEGLLEKIKDKETSSDMKSRAIGVNIIGHTAKTHVPDREKPDLKWDTTVRELVWDLTPMGGKTDAASERIWNMYVRQGTDAAIISVSTKEPDAGENVKKWVDKVCAVTHSKVDDFPIAVLLKVEPGDVQAAAGKVKEIQDKNPGIPVYTSFPNEKEPALAKPFDDIAQVLAELRK